MNRNARCWTIALCAGLLGCSSQPQPGAEETAAEVKILQFYANPGVVARGEPVTVCYGVENASSVRIEPPVETITPSLNRCFQITPQQEQTYTLVAEGAGGKRATESLTIRVQGSRKSPPSSPAHQMISLFLASSKEVSSGQRTTLCYGLEGATSARIEPGIGNVEVKDKNCITINPARTTTYTLVANGPSGNTDRQQLTVTVH